MTADTDRRHETEELHRLSVVDCLARIQAADHAVLAAVERARPAIAGLLDAAEPGFRDGGRLVFVGAGTAGRLGVFAASEAATAFQVPRWRLVGILAGGDAALRRDSQRRQHDPRGALGDLLKLGLGGRDTVIGLTATGTTPYVRGGLAWCAARGEPPLTALVSCRPCQKPPGVGHLIRVETGPEVVADAIDAKAGTASKLILDAIVTTLMIRTGRVYRNQMVELKAHGDALRERARRVVATLTGLERSAADALLERAGGRVKCAVVMHHRGFSRAVAELALAASDDRIDEALAGDGPGVEQGA